MIYLDYQATTPLLPEARAAMLPFLESKFGNPHSPHRPGREAKVAVEIARVQVLDALLAGSDAKPEDGRLFFTSGATEALNWAIKGTLAQAAPSRAALVVSAIEHAAVLDTAAALARAGTLVRHLPVTAAGLVEPDRAATAICADTALVALMLVNNEIGTIQPVAEVGSLAHAAGARMLCDAVQGFTKLPVSVHACDLVAISAHKIGGPKGIGALWVRRGCEPAALLDGGGQEGGLRSGTLSPMLCAGFGAAAAASAKRKTIEGARLARLAQRFRDRLGPGWILNGDAEQRWPGNLNLRRDGVDAGRLISDLRTLAFSAGSACASGSGRPSHVLTAIGLTERAARSSIRIGLGPETTEADMDEAAGAIAAATAQQLAYA